MPNILDIGAPGQSPTSALHYAASQLEAAAQAATAAAAPAGAAAAAAAGVPAGAALPAAGAATGVAPPAAAPPAMTDKAFKEIVERKINSVHGRLKGPSQNARALFDRWLQPFKDAGYPMTVDGVQSAFANFLLALATEGFENKDTTGTQMGNFQGSWRGGGFT